MKGKGAKGTGQSCSARAVVAEVIYIPESSKQTASAICPGAWTMGLGDVSKTEPRNSNVLSQRKQRNVIIWNWHNTQSWHKRGAVAVP